MLSSINLEYIQNGVILLHKSKTENPRQLRQAFGERKKLFSTLSLDAYSLIRDKKRVFSHLIKIATKKMLHIITNTWEHFFLIFLMQSYSKKIAHIRSFLLFVAVYLSEFSWLIFLQNNKQKYTIHSLFLAKSWIYNL